jgi:hypothetical protein
MAEQKPQTTERPLMSILLLIPTCLIVGFLIVWYGLKPFEFTLASIVESLIFVVLSGFATVIFTILASRFNFVRTKLGQTMFMLAAAFLLWFLAEITWFLYLLAGMDPGVPSIADVFWVGGYIPAAIALLLNAQAIRAKFTTSTMGVWAIATILVAALVIALEVFPFVSASPDIGTLVTVIYPIFDTAIFSLALVTLLKFKSGEVAKPWAALIIGFLLTSVGDIWYTYATWTESYATAYNPVDFFLTLGYLAYVVSGILFMRLYGK